MKKPQPFGKYLLLDRINVGGMAEVFLAKTFGVEGFERILAIKKIIPTMVEDEEFINMFIDEARIAVQLNHANIVQIHELGKHEEHYYIAMEYVSGRDVRLLLDAVKKRKQMLPLPLAAFVVHEVCKGLDYAHRKKDSQGREMNIVHRDVSPQNVLISYDGTVKVIDFGIAKAQNRIQKTQAGILKGKFGYMSPEQVRGLPIDRRSDIFALGVILYEMLTGERLFMGESDFSTLEKVRNAEVLPPREYNDQVPEELEKVVMKSLTREPEDRYQWAGEMGEDLMRFLVQGDMVFGQKHLANYMADFFIAEIAREQEKMAKFGAVARPEGTPISAVGPTPVAPAAVAPPPAPPPAGLGIRAARTVLDLDAVPSDPNADNDEPGAGERTQLYDPVFASPTPAQASPIPSPPPPDVASAARTGGTQTLEMPVMSGDKAPTVLNMPAVTGEGQTVIKAEPGGRGAAPVAAPSAMEATTGEGQTVIKDVSSPKSRPPSLAPSAPKSTGEVRVVELESDPSTERTGPALPRAVRLVPATRPAAAPAGAPSPIADLLQKHPSLKPIAIGVGIGLVLVLVLVIAQALTRHAPQPAADLATLVISPDVADGAQISIDGRQLTEAEHHTFVARELVAGDHVIEAKNQYGTRAMKVSVQPGAMKPVEMAVAQPPAPAAPSPAPEAATGPAAPTPTPAAPQPKLGLDLSTPPPAPGPPIQVLVQTDPPDAEIFVDRQSVGHGSYTLTSTDADHLYHLRATAPGRRPAEKTTRITAAQTVTLVLREGGAEHAPSPGSGGGGGHHRGVKGGPPGTLIISSKPVAKVFVDGRSTERYTPVAPSDPLEIPSGEHLIHLESDDGKKADQHVTIQPHTLTKLLGVPLN